jgi:hypothetical protein
MVSGTGNNKASAGRDIERILSVSPRTYNVDRLVGRKVYGYSGCKQRFTKTDEFFYLDAASGIQ